MSVSYTHLDVYKRQKFFASETEVHVTLSVQKEQQKIEVTIPVKGHIIRSEQESNDMYVSIELVEEVIERQLKKYKNKLIDKKRNAADFAPEYVDEDEEIFEDEEVKIIRAKKFGIKPMNAEEACVQTVSYTHLDVYKRQEVKHPGRHYHDHGDGHYHFHAEDEEHDHDECGCGHNHDHDHDHDHDHHDHCLLYTSRCV